MSTTGKKERKGVETGAWGEVQKIMEGTKSRGMKGVFKGRPGRREGTMASFPLLLITEHAGNDARVGGWDRMGWKAGRKEGRKVLKC